MASANGSKICVDCPTLSGQRGSIEIDALPLHDLALAIKRTVIGVFAHQHMRQETGTAAATLNRALRQRGLHDLVTAFAGHARAHDPVHGEASRNVFQFFGNNFSNGPEIATTSTCLARAQHLLVARQFRRQWLALRFFLRLGRGGGIFFCCDARSGSLFLFKRKLQVELIG